MSKLWTIACVATGVLLLGCAPEAPTSTTTTTTTSLPPTPTPFACGSLLTRTQSGGSWQEQYSQVSFYGVLEGFGVVSTWSGSGLSCSGEPATTRLAYLTEGEAERCPQSFESATQYLPGGQLTTTNGVQADGPYTICAYGSV